VKGYCASRKSLTEIAAPGIGQRISAHPAPWRAAARIGVSVSEAERSGGAWRGVEQPRIANPKLISCCPIASFLF